MAIDTTATDNSILLEGQNIYNVQFVEAGLPYKKGQRFKDKKTYSRYTYKGIAFSVPTEHPFNADFGNGQVKTITLLPGNTTLDRIDDDGNSNPTDVPTLDFSAYLNRIQWKGLQEDRMEEAKVESTIARYAYLATAPVTPEMLVELAKGSA